MKKIFEGQLNGREITGTWVIADLAISQHQFKIAHAKKNWKGTHKQDGKDHEMIIEHMNIFKN